MMTDNQWEQLKYFETELKKYTTQQLEHMRILCSIELCDRKGVFKEEPTKVKK